MTQTELVSDYLARLDEARRMAADGYGWTDIVIKCRLTMDVAVSLVLDAETKRRQALPKARSGA